MVRPGDSCWRGTHHILICVSRSLLLRGKRGPACDWGVYVCMSAALTLHGVDTLLEGPGCVVEQSLLSRSGSRECTGVGALSLQAGRCVEGGWPGCAPWGASRCPVLAQRGASCLESRAGVFAGSSHSSGGHPWSYVGAWVLSLWL